MRAFRILTVLLFITGTRIAHAGPVHDAVLEGKSCVERASQQRDCEYKIGKEFWLSIAAVGTPMVTAHFMTSNFEGSYYASFLSGSGCVMISKGSRSVENADVLDLAYISLKSGNVYVDVADCEVGN
jgi:hypothetical protein